MQSSDSSSNKRVKIFGAIIAVVALVALGVVALNSSNAQVMPLDRAEALAKLENANVPMSQLPEESEVHTPNGWEVESDTPVGSEEEEDDDDSSELMQDNPVEEDEDIDSPMDIEQDENGQKFVAELGEGVMVDFDEPENLEEGMEEKAVAAQADGKYLRCKYKLKKCGYKKRCLKKCNKKCKPYAIKKCKAKKFCKCFCKYYGKIKAARKCVIYKKKKCKVALTYKCKRGCKKYCKNVPACYCCPKRKIAQKCNKLCKKISYKTKCGKCRCYKTKCVKKCLFVCKKYL